MNHSTPGLPVHHQLLQFTQTHVHRVSDAIQPSHPLSSSSPPAPIPPSIRVFPNESVLHISWPKYFCLSLSIIPPMNIQNRFPLGSTGLSPFSPRDSQESSPTPRFKSINFFGSQPSLWSKSHIQHDCWKNHSFYYMDLC